MLDLKIYCKKCGYASQIGSVKFSLAPPLIAPIALYFLNALYFVKYEGRTESHEQQFFVK